MTELLHNPKIKPEHLARKAIVYLRQSSDKQVRQNKESQLLQYAMAERVRALGWQEVEIINNDLGSSAGLAAAQREGFERVLSSVALGSSPFFTTLSTTNPSERQSSYRLLLLLVLWERGRRSPSTFPSDTVPTGGLAPGQRWSVGRKREVVLRLLRGEAAEACAGIGRAAVPAGALARARAIGDRRIGAGTRGRCGERRASRGYEADRRTHNGE